MANVRIGDKVVKIGGDNYIPTKEQIQSIANKLNVGSQSTPNELQASSATPPSKYSATFTNKYFNPTDIAMGGVVGASAPQDQSFQTIDYQEKDLSRKVLPQLITGLSESNLLGSNMPFAQPPISPEQMPRPQGVPAILARGVGNVAPDIVQSIPFMGGAGLIPKLTQILKGGVGFGTYGAAKEALKGGSPKEIASEAASHGVSAMAFHGAGRIGATVANKILSPALKYAPHLMPWAERLGSSAGGAGAGGVLGGEEGAILGGALSFLYPSSRFKGKSPQKYAEEATNEYRMILKPSKSQIGNIELGKGRNIDDYYRLAAQEGLQIKESGDKGAKTIDTIEAIEQVQNKIANIGSDLNQRMKSSQKVQFDLNKVREIAKREVRKNFETDLDYYEAVKDVDSYIDASIGTHGKIVDGLTLNKIKQGMWRASYNALRHTADKTARKIGFVMKNLIEKNYPNADVKGLNSLSGDYATLLTLLKNAHGRSVKGGIGKFRSQLVGALAGLKAPVVGPILGGMAGGKVSEYLGSPTRASRVAASKAQKGGMTPPTIQLNPILGQPLPQGAKQLPHSSGYRLAEMISQLQPMLRANPRVPYSEASVPRPPQAKPQQEYTPARSGRERAFEKVPIEGEGFVAYQKELAEFKLAEAKMKMMKDALARSKARLAEMGESFKRRFKEGD